MVQSRATFLTVLGAGTALAGVRAPAAAQQLSMLHIGAPLADTFATPFYIKDAGTFAKIGYDVQLSTIPAAIAVVAAIAGGTLELGIADIVGTAQAFNRGVPVTIIAGCSVYDANASLVFICTAKDSPVKTVRDLNGRTLALPQLGGIGATAAKAWLTANGADVDKVKLVELPQPSAGVAIARGTVDAGLIGEPFYTPVKNEIRDIGHPMDAIGKLFYLSVWVASRSWFEADPARARRIVGAINDTQRWANTHRAETLAILAREGKMDIEPIRNMTRATYATSLNIAEIQPVLDIADKFKLIEKPVDANAMISRA